MFELRGSTGMCSGKLQVTFCARPRMPRLGYQTFFAWELREGFTILILFLTWFCISLSMEYRSLMWKEMFCGPMILIRYVAWSLTSNLTTVILNWI